MPAKLFTEWELYWEREPFGPAQEDLRAGHIASLIHNTHRGSGRALQPGDFFPSLKTKDETKASPEETKYAVMSWVLSIGGIVKEPNG